MSAESSKCASLKGKKKKKGSKRKGGMKNSKNVFARYLKKYIPNPLCVAQSEKQTSDKTSSGQSVSNEFKKPEELTLLCTEKAYSTNLGNDNPEKDDSIPTRNGSNLERKGGMKNSKNVFARYLKKYIPNPLCVAQSEKQTSDKTSSGQSVSNEFKKPEELTLLCTEKAYSTNLGNDNPEKDDSIPTRNGSNLERKRSMKDSDKTSARYLKKHISNSMCVAQSEKQTSDKTSSGQLVSNEFKKPEELALLCTEKAYSTNLGNYNPEKDDSIPTRNGSNLERKRSMKDSDKTSARYLKKHISNSMCVAQSEKQTSDKTSSGQLVSNEFKKPEELALLFTEKAYSTNLGNYNPEKDDSIPTRNGSNLEIPSWRIMEFDKCYSKKGTEDMSDKVFEERHLKGETKERRIKKWDVQKFREFEMREKLIKGRNKKHHSQSVKKEELTTFWPDKANLNEIEFTDLLPVSVFGTNILIKKNSPPFEFYRCSWVKD